MASTTAAILAGEILGNPARLGSIFFQPRQPLRQDAFSPKLNGGSRSIQLVGNLLIQGPFRSHLGNARAQDQSHCQASSSFGMGKTTYQPKPE